MNKQQTNLLNEIKRAGLYDYSHLSANERDTLFYLKSLKYITTKANPKGEQRPVYKITELGKAELFKTRQKNFRFWLPIILSNLMALSALIISIISLTK